MNRHFSILLILSLAIVFYSCLPDRMPSAPEEIDRPVFAKFDFGETNLNVPLNKTIMMHFNEPMDLNSFAAGFKVESVGGEIKGSFSYGSSDTIVVFTPATNYLPAEYYVTTLTGVVRDIHGNSVTSPTAEDIPQQDWFFTSGNYSNNGFPYVFVRDKSARNIVYRMGELNKYIDNFEIPGTIDYQTSGLEIEPLSDNLFIVNLKVTDGLVTVVNPSDLSVITQIPVGLGPTNIEFSDQRAYVTNLSAKSFSVINLASLANEATHVFPDGFRGKDVSYSKLNNSLYFYSSVNSDIKKVDADDFNNTGIFPSGLATRPTDIEITRDGKYLYMIGTNSNEISVIDIESETADPLTLDYQYLTDGAIGENYYYVAYYRGTGGENVGGILKIDLNSKSIAGHLEWEYQVDQMKLTSSEELLYAVTPVDSTVQIIETRSMHKIASGKIEGSLKFLAVTGKNY